MERDKRAPAVLVTSIRLKPSLTELEEHFQQSLLRSSPFPLLSPLTPSPAQSLLTSGDPELFYAMTSNHNALHCLEFT